ncbi:MAG: hypothetical protein HY939_02890 [Gammaproteobacteria bacterium]|nr:hypothetical protein [Gammaproteobacteria bacterium]
MCLILIPLAGPDFYTEQFGIRPLYPVGHTTLIEHVLAHRPWINDHDSNQLVFILRDEGIHTKQVQTLIMKRFPSAHTVILSDLSAGAPLSALAGLALAKQYDTPVIIDLADIVFTMPQDVCAYFYSNPYVDAVVPYFDSSNPKFSYISLDGDVVTKAREKQLISTHASTGVYFFRNVTAYLQAMIYCFQHLDICKIGASFFICPSVNGLISQNRQVRAIKVTQVEDMSTLFHEN